MNQEPSVDGLREDFVYNEVLALLDAGNVYLFEFIEILQQIDPSATVNGSAELLDRALRRLLASQSDLRLVRLTWATANVTELLPNDNPSQIDWWTLEPDLPIDTASVALVREANL